MSAAVQAFRVGVNPVVQLCHTFNSAIVKYPFYSGVIISGLKTSAADLFAQKIVEEKEHIDWKRFGLFTAFGYIYLGGFQYLLYSKLIGRAAQPLLNITRGKYEVPILTALDQFVYHPFMYLPAFYLFKGACTGQPINDIYGKFKEEFKSNCQALWTIWIPAQVVNFRYVPMHLRVPYVALISFVWTVVLSQMRGQCEEIKQDYPNPSYLKQPAEDQPNIQLTQEITHPLQKAKQYALQNEQSVQKQYQIEAEQNFEGDSYDTQAQINKWLQNQLFGSYIKEQQGEQIYAPTFYLNMVASVSQAEAEHEECINEEESKQ